MKCVRPTWPCLVLMLLVLSGPAARLAAADSLVWHRQPDRVDADISSWDLETLLEHVAAATGWQIYVDPAAARTVSAKFDNLPPRDALRWLLGSVNFVVVPQTNSVSQLYVFRTSRQQATKLITAAAPKKAQPIPNQLVVTLKPGSKTKIEDLARSLGAKIIGRMDDQNAYLLQFDNDAATQAARQQLLDNSDVASVDYNYPIDRSPTAQTSQVTTPDLQLTPRTNSNNNCPLIIGLIDTPVQSLGSNLDAFVKPAISVAGGCAPSTTQITHGTAMAETILRAVQAKTGGNTSVRILPIDVYGCNESTSTFNVAQGLAAAYANGATIMNMSLGSTGDSSFLHNVITQLSQQNVPMYAVAGNEPVTTPTYPAAYPEVIGVTASDSAGNIASYANRGSFIKMIAPGDNIVPFDGQSFMVEGTSTSTAFVSGMAAGLADSAHECPPAAQSLLQKSLKPFPATKP